MFAHLFSYITPGYGKVNYAHSIATENFVMENFESSFQFSANGAETRPYNDMNSLHRKLELHMRVAMCLEKCTVIKFQLFFRKFATSWVPSSIIRLSVNGSGFMQRVGYAKAYKVIRGPR